MVNIRIASTFKAKAKAKSPTKIKWPFYAFCNTGGTSIEATALGPEAYLAQWIPLILSHFWKWAEKLQNGILSWQISVQLKMF